MVTFWEGVIAGLGVAVPVGAIALLIVDVGLRRGFQAGFMAGAGAASVDFFYAGVAALTGEVLALALSPYKDVLRLISALLLFIIGGFGLWRVRKISTTSGAKQILVQGKLRVYAQFLGLTLINPLTIVYFSALILSREASYVITFGERVAFVVGAGLASLSWQTLLAALGATARRNLSPRFQLIASLLGNMVMIGFGLRILLRLVL
ncbi:MAG: lysine transporter LysE [Anaerolineales bacterium]|nr:MAG: lysine transporter LysE [Anaerolineales bacterium]